MIILYIILVLIALSSFRFLKKGEQWNADYISKDTTNVVKGICIWIVFICHISGYMGSIPTLNVWDNLLFDVKAYIRQLLVVPFLFYSGYGVTLAIIKKGEAYAKKIPVNRMLPTIVNFDIAVFIFLLMNIALGQELEVGNTLLAFTGWESIRNSNWYIFCILICYFISWASYRLFGTSKRMIIAVWFGILFYTAVIYFFKGPWWYDTIYAYGAGVCFAYWKDKAENLIKRYYWILLVGSLTGFVLFYNAPNLFCIAADITAVFLCALVVLLTIKIKLQSKVLAWSGSNLFPLYIYQRLPMFFLSTIMGGVFMNEHRYLYIVSCLAITLIIVAMYKYIKYPRKPNLA